MWSWNYRDKQDVVIVWRYPKPVDYDINATKVFVDLHDTLPPGEFEGRLDKITKIFVKSQAHRDLYPYLPDAKFAIIPNGADHTLFEKKVKRDPYYLVNFSSPDRSLDVLLDILVEVKKRLPKEIADKVTFSWFYGWGVYDAVRTSEKAQQWKAKLVKRFDELKKAGWVQGGFMINHERVAIENLKAGALVYPTEFYEIDFIGGTKAMLGGAVPITTDFAALRTKIKYGLLVPSKRTIDDWADIEDQSYGIRDQGTKEWFIEALLNYLQNPESFEHQRGEMKTYARQQYNWDRIINMWDEVLKA